jgi:hypothetical protein
MWYIHLSTGGSVDAKFIGVASLSKMCVKCRIWLKKYKIFLGRGNNPPTPLEALVIFTWATGF